MLFGSALSASGRPSANVESTVVRLPALTLTESNLTSTRPVAGGVAGVSTRYPIQEMPLGSVACTVMLSFTSTRDEIECETAGGVTSFPGVCTVTVTGGESARRPPASTANAVTVKEVKPACTVSVSVEIGSGGWRAGGGNSTEAVVGVGGPAPALRRGVK